MKFKEKSFYTLNDILTNLSLSTRLFNLSASLRQAREYQLTRKCVKHFNCFFKWQSVKVYLNSSVLFRWWVGRTRSSLNTWNFELFLADKYSTEFKSESAKTLSIYVHHASWPRTSHFELRRTITNQNWQLNEEERKLFVTQSLTNALSESTNFH